MIEIRTSNNHALNRDCFHSYHLSNRAEYRLQEISESFHQLCNL